MKAKKIFSLLVVVALGLYGVWAVFGMNFLNTNQTGKSNLTGFVNEVYAADFEYLSQNGNSACSKEFLDSIASLPEGEKIRGSCCSKMNMHVYSEQREGLKKYSAIAEIPADPYNIDAQLAKKMLAFYDTPLSPEQQSAYDFAMQNSSNKGPCCCKCWRWQFYGGLAKFLIVNNNFTGEQITEIWNLSDGCGGEDNHVYHPGS